MATHIRSAERFEREGRRGIRHKQSSEYKDVVRKLRLYHRDTAVTSARHGADLANDEIFRVSPAQMWREFMHKQGISAETHAVFVGIQHKGKVDRNMDSRTLGVGLNKPPVPKRAGRPHLTPQGLAWS